MTHRELLRGAEEEIGSDQPAANATQRRRVRLPPNVSRGRLAALVFLVLVGGFLALQVGRQVYANHAITQRAAAMRAEIEATRAANRDIERQLAYLRSDAYVGQQARRIANLGMPGEQVLIIPPGAAVELPPQLRPAPPDKPLLEQWIELFFAT